MRRALRSAHLAWAAAALALGLLAWQGHRVAHWLPQLEHGIAELGPWGPLALVAAIVLLSPLFVPDSIFGVAAGACFGLVAGTATYFAGVYLACLAIQIASHRWLRERVLRQLASRPRLRAVVAAASQGGARFAFLVRMVPINQALLSYALGAAGVPLRFTLLGNTAILTHLFPTVYLGVAAAHLTRMAAGGHREWELEGALLLLGLGACALLALQVSRLAWAAIDAEARAAGALPSAS